MWLHRWWRFLVLLGWIGSTPSSAEILEGTLAAHGNTTTDTSVDPASTGASMETRVRALEAQWHTLTERLEVESTERLLQDARHEAQAAPAEAEPEQREFLEGGLALQKLNPELTLSADILATLVLNGTKFYAGEQDRSGLGVRALGLHFQHVLDPSGPESSSSA
ncbi:MAG: hypothetical protein A2284_10130 [Deltaproteobacteria bacterium RIFOXYA12_FULL_61_11]|nr:MAG: hypothetical protein A2284_10130 [Deltaproteobacteria bacterium RIFOXYA12_FULL_61_11]